MEKTNNFNNFTRKKRTKDILRAFNTPKTPRQVERKLGIKKIKLNTFLKNKLIRLLNQGTTKGRVYVSTLKARQLFRLPAGKSTAQLDWAIIGWILASPKQRKVILKVLNSVKKTSEEIRQKASRLNRSFTRISTKTTLNELVGKGLVDTELKPRLRRIINGCSIYGKKLRRYYWLNKKGERIQKDIEKLETDNK